MRCVSAWAGMSFFLRPGLAKNNDVMFVFAIVIEYSLEVRKGALCLRLRLVKIGHEWSVWLKQSRLKMRCARMSRNSCNFTSDGRRMKILRVVLGFDKESQESLSSIKQQCKNGP